MADLTPLIAYSINGVSVFMSLIVAGVFWGLRQRCPGVVDRVSLRLSVAASIIDLFYSGCYIWLYVSTRKCGVPMAFYIFTLLLSMFIYGGMAINIQYVFLAKRKGRLELERWYYVVSLGAAATLSLVAFFSNSLGWNSDRNLCWFAPGASNFLWSVLLLHMWIVIVILYSVVVVGVVLATLGTEEHWLRKTISEANGVDATQLRRRRVREIRLLVRRVSLYPLIPILAQLAMLVVEGVLHTWASVPTWLVQLSVACSSMQGCLNFLAFCVDPAVITASESVIGDIRDWYQDPGDEKVSEAASDMPHPAPLDISASPISRKSRLSWPALSPVARTLNAETLSSYKWPLSLDATSSLRGMTADASTVWNYTSTCEVKLEALSQGSITSDVNNIYEFLPNSSNVFRKPMRPYDFFDV